MAPRHVFGLTPWGRAFIEAMEALGDKGRLDRGRAYAGNDKVVALRIDDGKVKARVEGHYRPFYKVEIAFPPFSATEKARLLDIVSADPLALERIELGDFPECLLDDIGEAGIRLFPRRWSDMKRSCDCPDSGDPCKHEAAVYYIIAQEIDRSPAALFRLRGLDLAKPRIASKGKSAERQGLPPRGDRDIADSLPIRLVPSWVEAEIGGQAPLELPSISSYAVLLPRLLPAGPALAGLDLSLGLTEFFHRLARDWELPFLGPGGSASEASGKDSGAGLGETVEDAIEKAERSLAFSESHIAIQARRCLVALPAAVGRAEGKKAAKLLLSPFAAAYRVLACDFAEGSRSYLFLRRFALAMRSIVAAGAIHPALVVEGGRYSIIWKPASFGLDVQAALAWVEAAAFEELVERPSPKRPASGEGIPDPASLVRLLAKDFLGEYVLRLHFRPAGRLAAASPISQALFAGAFIDASSPSARSLPSALASRLSAYELVGAGANFELTAKASKTELASALAESRLGHSGLPSYRLSAAIISAKGERYPLYKAESRLGRGALAFPALLSAFVPGLELLGTRPSVLLEEEELESLIVEAEPILQRIGVSVILPKELKKLAQPKAILSSSPKAARNLTTIFDLATAFSFEWKVAIGGELIDPREFEALVARGATLFRFRNAYVRLDPAEAAAILERIRRERSPDALGALRAVLAGEVEEDGELALAIGGLLSGLGRASARAPVEQPPPQGLNARLRPYQERGYRWLLRNLDLGFGCLLADDMGLGKTIQTIALILALKERGQLIEGVLVIAPASLLTNWEREIAKFAPGLSSLSHYGAKRHSMARSVDVLLTTYETYVRDQKRLSAKNWDLAVLDEAHLIKNPGTKRSRAVKALKATRRIALTGTPVENNLMELWSLFDFIIPGFLGGAQVFSREFRGPIEVERSLERAAKLRRITSPFIMRRLKTDKAIAPDLPEKIVIDEYASLTSGQAALYEAVASESLARIEAAEGIERCGLVLGLILALKQVANHPRNWDKESPPASELSGKSRLLLSLLDSSMEAGERVLVFSQYVEMILIMKEMIARDLGVEPYLLHGRMSKAKRDEAVDRFQHEKGPGILLVSLKAGGLGLNLTAASRVIHYDLWFNPAVESQATDRAFRIGQSKDVFVHRLVTRGSLEERINSALATKRELADMAVGVGETWITELGNKELRELIRLER